MKLSTTIVPALSALLLASTASAQVFSELQNSRQGSNDPEFIELEGAPGQSTNGLMILAVESETFTTTPAGRLQAAFDLSGFSFGPADKYYVFGSLSADTTYAGAIDFVANSDNLFQNQSNTFYLVSVPDLNKRMDIIQNMVGQDVSTAPGANTTVLASDPMITILDLVALSDGDPTDVFFDNALVLGPEPSGFYPAGVARNGSCPGDWCSDVFLEWTFNPAALPFIDATPGADNPLTPCTAATSIGICGSGGGLGDPYCMTNVNSTGVTAVLSAAGSILIADNDVTLTVSEMPNGSFGYLLVSLDQGLVLNPNMSSGNLCLGGSIGRYVGPGQIQNSGAVGTFDLAIDLSMIPSPTGFVAAMPGVTWNFQSWFRDTDGMGGLTSNFTQGLEITFQ